MTAIRQMVPAAVVALVGAIALTVQRCSYERSFQQSAVASQQTSEALVERTRELAAERLARAEIEALTKRSVAVKKLKQEAKHAADTGDLGSYLDAATSGTDAR